MPSSLPSSLSVAAPLETKRVGDDVLVAMTPTLEVRLFELTGDLVINQTGGVDDDVPSASAQQVYYDEGDNLYIATDEVEEVTLYHVLAGQVGGEPHLFELASGARVWGAFNSQSDRWEIISPRPQSIIRFKTQASFAAGNATVSVKLWIWNGAAYAESGSAFNVYNSLNIFAAATSAKLGLAVWMPDRGVYEIMQLACDT